MDDAEGEVVWVLLTMGDRPVALDAAVVSVLDDGSTACVVANGCESPEVAERAGVDALVLDHNTGVPGGRDAGVRATRSEIVAFLDDDAVLRSGATAEIVQAFRDDPSLGAVALRLVDEAGETSRRHVPRRGVEGADVSGKVALFLGGASAIRREAYEEVGGYFTDLHYGHEELELSWRLVDAGWSIRYLADVTVFHPRTDISRHASGWHLTGRNRVWIARRTLPALVALVHVGFWLVMGTVRAPSGCRRSYIRGWLSGWRGTITRSPIRWKTVLTLARLGRPPIF